MLIFLNPIVTSQLWKRLAGDHEQLRIAMISHIKPPSEYI
jgi:hypothetical protein